MTFKKKKASRVWERASRNLGTFKKGYIALWSWDHLGERVFEVVFENIWQSCQTVNHKDEEAAVGCPWWSLGKATDWDN